MDVNAQRLASWFQYMRDVQAAACDAKRALYDDDKAEAYAALDRMLEAEPSHWTKMEGEE